MTKHRFIFIKATVAGCLFLLVFQVAILRSFPQASQNHEPTGWPVVGADLGNTRYSPLAQVSAANINQLSETWASRAFQDGAASRSTPVIHRGLLFVTAGTGVYAMNAQTGQTAWVYHTDSSQGPKSGDTTAGLIEVWKAGRALPNSQGVAIGEGQVFVGLTDGRVIALDEKTGELKWSRQAGDDPPKKGQSVSAAPTYSDGIVFIGLANGDYHLRGRLVALDAKTGQELWHFFTVPGPGETGHETWAQDNEVWKVGGGGVWQTPTIDPALSTVYFVVGNPVPQYAGEVRPGNNLFTSSVVALDMKTGNFRWYYQVVHHDIWDSDIATALILYDAQYKGTMRKGLAAIRPDGYLFLLDRQTGKPLIPVEERAVPQNEFQKTSRTQPFPIGAESLLPDCSTWKERIPAGFVLGCTYTPYSLPPPSSDPPNILATGFTVRGTPMSYSPETGYFYAHGNAGLGWRRRAEDPYFFGVTNHVPGLKSFGVIGAIDSRTDKIVWKKEIPISIFGRGGELTTAGGLMFRLEGDGNFLAYDAKTGDQLWKFQTGSAGAAGSPATYEIDGIQYIAIPAGPVVFAFKLNGLLQPSQAPELPAVEDFSGPITDTKTIETSTLDHATVLTGGNRYYVDEYEFNPYRARVKLGTTVTWTNNGILPHTISALDGSWSTGVLNPTEEKTVTFSKPGTYTYICKEHPWTYGQIIVLPESEAEQQDEKKGDASVNVGAKGKK